MKLPVIVKVGGVNGSGKTALARAIMNIGTWVEVLEPAGKHRVQRPEAYLCTDGPFVGWVVLGSYRNVCGGMDTMTDKDDRLALVRKWADNKKVRCVFFEGMMTGHTYGAFGAMSEEAAHTGRWVYVFMDTPFEECVRRVLERRKAAGNLDPFDPDKSMKTTHRGCLSVQRIAKLQGHETYFVDHQELPPNGAKALLKFVNKYAGKK